ncbi:carbohydrate porin [Terricaulis sp.]|uniref:carbohydrate porin n=1 Tax=Terricaulis sp. TaxID=2768686 RepID=UPI002AC78B8A|nr:carbohydrate porin [Terricaulis sp.]MDZ4692276.1 carbohydrate porin [Terricaulis sp.]
MCGASFAYAQEPVQFELEYTGDIIGPISGAQERGAYLDNLDLSATFDMAALAGWREGTIVFAHVLSNSGDTPNDAAQTLQGIDNIEVSRQAIRLYEFWVETNIGALNARAGLYDVNSEFYSNEAAGLLIAPAFGIGSELAATGPNGPSIFPSTALALRVRAPLSERLSAQFAVVNAYAGVPGDPGGVDTALDDGALLISELSWDGDTHVDVGAWTYTDQQEDIRLTTGLGAPVYQRAAGAYVTLEREVQPGATLFARVGVSDGDTTPYIGGWQAGVLFDGVLAARPDSQLSFGAYQGRLSSKFRGNQRDAGVRAADAESGVELTYSDQITPWLRLQPDVQIVIDPSGDRDRQDVWIAGLRFVITPFGH